MHSIDSFSQWVRRTFPILLIALWLTYVGVMVWQHARESVQPPLFDPLTYIKKARNFWKAIDERLPFNPLDIEPTTRPPGTILVSYPFGFSFDFKGFQFRSIFFPIVCLTLAVFIVTGLPMSRLEAWWAAAFAALFSSIPLFYNFDYNESFANSSYWGLVDAFQASVAALAIAGYIRSLKSLSVIWLLTGAVLGAVTLLIKPSGLMIMALLTLSWMIVIAGMWRSGMKKNQPVAPLRNYVIIGGILMTFIYASFAALCFYSEYFSKENFAYAKQALKVMERVLKTPLNEIVILIISSFGIAAIAWIVITFVWIFMNLRTPSETRPRLTDIEAGFLLSTPVIWGLGGWYWLVVQAGGNQVRYFYPFLVMGLVCMIPVSMVVLWNSRDRLRRFIQLLCILPAINIGVMLAMDSPSPAWQRFNGVNVTVGQDKEEVLQACVFLDEFYNRNENANLYSFFHGLPDVFINVAAYEQLIWHNRPIINIALMIDWVKGFTVKTDDLLNSDYILIRKDFYGIADRLDGRMKNTAFAENIIFQDWLSSLDTTDGVRPISDGSVLRLLEIVDRSAFEYAVATFVSTNTWRPEFIDANSPSRWSNESEVSINAGAPSVCEIVFGDYYQLHRLSFRRLENGIKLEVWWERLKSKNEKNQYFMFFHFVDSSGNILINKNLPLEKYYPPFDDRRWRYGSVLVEETLPEAATAVAFGIFSPDHRFLMPDKGEGDWSGMRVWVPIPAAETKSTM